MGKIPFGGPGGGFEVRIKSGETLKGWHWPADRARVNLTIMTGMNEYALRYAPFAEWLNGHGVNVWCLDAFGQGLNAPSYNMQERWPLKAFQKNVQAICRMTRLARRNGLRTFLLGHSMGSFMVQSFMERFPAGDRRDHSVRLERRPGASHEGGLPSGQEHRP